MYKAGCVVYSIAGHDKRRFYTVVRESGGSVWIADGKRRKLGAPKRKNERHVQKTLHTVDLNIVDTDKKLRAALAPLNNEERADMVKEGGNSRV